LIPLDDDPRLPAAIAMMNRRDYAEAADEFEELFFEAVRDEVEFVRVFLQVATGAHHIERGQKHTAVERLAEGVKAIDRVTNDRGYDLVRLRADVAKLMRDLRAGGAFTWPQVFARDATLESRRET
jgi:predicted metal-dependent hydrolase